MTSSQGSTVTGRPYLSLPAFPNQGSTGVTDAQRYERRGLGTRCCRCPPEESGWWVRWVAMNLHLCHEHLWKRCPLTFRNKKRLSLNWNPVKDPGDFWRIRGSGLRFGLYFEIQTNYQKLGVCSHDRLATVLCHFCVYSLCHFSM